MCVDAEPEACAILITKFLHDETIAGRSSFANIKAQLSCSSLTTLSLVSFSQIPRYTTHVCVNQNRLQDSLCCARSVPKPTS
jgi:hypothetical protein